MLFYFQCCYAYSTGLILIMRDVNNGWAVRYTHGAPCDGLLEQTNNVENSICLHSIIFYGLINHKRSEQLITLGSKSVGPDCRKQGGLLYGQVDELDTSSWAKYTLVVLSRICRPLSILWRRVHVIFANFNRIDDVHIWIQLIIDGCKVLSNNVFKQCKPGEVTASNQPQQGGIMRTQSHRSTCSMLNTRKGDRFSKLVEPKTFRRNLSTGGISKVPDSPLNREERTSIPVSSWVSEQLTGLQESKSNKYNGLINIISNVDFLIACYFLIKGKPGNMSPGTTAVTLDGLKLSYFKQLSADLKSGQFNFTTNRRILIPKDVGKRVIDH